jgi:hydroxylamine dehydrogenase
MPEDKQWSSDRTIILQALGVLDPERNPTARPDVVKQADVARLTQEARQTERDKMLKICNQYRSINFDRGELEKGDQSLIPRFYSGDEC